MTVEEGAAGSKWVASEAHVILFILNEPIHQMHESPSWDCEQRLRQATAARVAAAGTGRRGGVDEDVDRDHRCDSEQVVGGKRQEDEGIAGERGGSREKEEERGCRKRGDRGRG
jgi:hypothetical protein